MSVLERMPLENFKNEFEGFSLDQKRKAREFMRAFAIFRKMQSDQSYKKLEHKKKACINGGINNLFLVTLSKAMLNPQIRPNPDYLEIAKEKREQYAHHK